MNLLTGNHIATGSLEQPYMCNSDHVRADNAV
jgi:hypothetical protein